MQKTKGHLFLLSLFLVIALSSLDYSVVYSQKISYQLEVDERDWNSFHIRIMVENVNTNRLLFTMPGWRPGVYVRQDFGKYVRNFQAFDASAHSLPVSRLNTNTWSVSNVTGHSVRVEYDVDQTEQRMFGPVVDSTFAYVDGAMNFMVVNDWKNLPAKVDFQVPHGWKLATAMPPTDASFEYRVLNYEHLIDCPVYMSKFKEYYFTLNNRPFYVIFNKTAGIDVNNLLIMIKRIADYQLKFFNEIPFNNYFFMFYINDTNIGGSGLEHRNSTYLSFSKQFIKENLKLTANVVAHEFFHTWNIKRFFPESFGSCDYKTEIQSRNLWFSEGVTNYYADLTMLRAQIWSEQEFLSHQEKMIEELQENDDRFKTSAEMASWNAWENGYHSDGISYYTKGQLLGLLLDLTIREKTNNEKSLDDLMQFMNWWFGKYNRGFKEGDILRAINALCYYDFTEFYERYVRGTEELPYKKIFTYAGISCQIEQDTLPNLGYVRISGKENKVIAIDGNGPIAMAGLKIGDRLKSIHGTSVIDSFAITEIELSLTINEIIKIEAVRKGLPMTLFAKVGAKEKIDVVLGFMKDVTDKQNRIRSAWMSGISTN